jgi:hypothetical protein
VCVVCDQPAVREQVDALLEKGVTGNQVAVQLHLARATCYRHKRKCFVKRKEASYHFKRFDPNSQRIVIENQNGALMLHPSGQNITPAELRESDEVILIEYEKPSLEAQANILAAAQRAADALALEPQPETLPTE